MRHATFRFAALSLAAALAGLLAGCAGTPADYGIAGVTLSAQRDGSARQVAVGVQFARPKARRAGKNVVALEPPPAAATPK